MSITAIIKISALDQPSADNLAQTFTKAGLLWESKFPLMMEITPPAGGLSIDFLARATNGMIHTASTGIHGSLMPQIEKALVAAAAARAAAKNKGGPVSGKP